MFQTELNRRRIMAAISGGGYEAIDLGLPSGKKWATMNVGATKPEEYGLYFSWGNIEGHLKGEQYSFSQENYNNTSAASISQNLNLSQDAACAIMGASWRMPTKEEQGELYNETDSEYVSDYEGTGINGMKFCNKNDAEKFIFIPFGGCWVNANVSQEKEYFVIWSKTYVSSERAIAFIRKSSTYAFSPESRYIGFNIRAIQD